MRIEKLIEKFSAGSTHYQVVWAPPKTTEE